MRVSQLIFTELKSPANRPYGVERGSKYQDQDGPQASRIGADVEFSNGEGGRNGGDEGGGGGGSGGGEGGGGGGDASDAGNAAGTGGDAE
jgi:dCTP deaminase